MNAMMTGTSFTKKVVGSAWPPHFNRVIAEIQQRNIEAVGMPKWDEADQTLAKALQKELGKKEDGLLSKVEELKPPSPETEQGGSDDVGDISWVVPMVYLRYPANIPETPGHSWADAIAMATPIAHLGATAGAKAHAMTALDLLLKPDPGPPEHLGANPVGQPPEVGRAAPLVVDQEVGMLLADRRPADSEAFQAGAIDQFPGAMRNGIDGIVGAVRMQFDFERHSFWSSLRSGGAGSEQVAEGRPHVRRPQLPDNDL